MTGDNEPFCPAGALLDYFFVDDTVSTADFYRDKLGSGYNRFWMTAMPFAWSHAASVVIMLAQQCNGRDTPKGWSHPEGEARDALHLDHDADS